MLSGQRLVAVEVVLKMWYVNGSLLQDLLSQLLDSSAPIYMAYL